MEQIAIALLGVTAIWLAMDKRPHVQKWSCVLGLMGQPFWFYSAWKAQQWGIFVLCFFYTASWARGIKTKWLPNVRW